MTFYIRPISYRRYIAPRRWMRMAEDETTYKLAVDVREEDDAFVLTALTPGLKAEDVTITVLDDIVTIEGEFKRDDNKEYLICELPQGAFRRSLRLPTSIETGKAEARITDGVLTLRLPKAESARSKTIKVMAK